MGRIATFGWLAPRIQHAGTSLDFTPTKGWVNLAPAELDDRNIKRTAIITDEAKVIVKGQYPKYEYLFQHLTLAEIGAFLNINGETITLTPHSDYPGISFTCLVSNINIDDNDPRNVDLTISLICQDYDNAHKYLTVTSPNGSELYQRNQSVTITWTSAFVTGNVAIELWKDGSKLSDIDTDDANDGSYTWSVAADAVIDTDYKIKIKDVNTGLVYDLSDGDFTIDYDGYYQFDGSFSKLAVPSAINTFGTKFTILIMYNVNNIPIAQRSEFIASYVLGGTNMGITVLPSSYNTIDVDIGGSQVWSTATFPNTGTDWHYISIVVDHTLDANERIKIGFDGVDRTGTVTTPAGSSAVTFSSQLYIGGARYVMDSVKMKNFVVFNQAYTLSEITAIVNSTIPTDNVIFGYRMNDANTFAMPYGDFNGTNNYIDMGFKPADITSAKPFEIVFKHNNSSDHIYFGARDTTLSRYFYPYTLAGTGASSGIIMYYSGTSSENFTLAQIGAYANEWVKMKIEVSGVNFLISLWGLNADYSYTQISTTRTVAIGNLPDLNIYAGSRNTNGTATLYANQIAYIKGNANEWYLRPFTSTTIKSLQGTSLTVQGTLTSFWVNDEPYTEATKDILGVNDGTPTAVIPQNFFNQS